MRRLAIATIITALPWVALAAPTWQTISSEPGKRIELDRTSLKRDGNSVQAQGRVVLERELVDAKSGAGYRVIEALTRYDCNTRNASTLKRIYKKNETEVIREEEIKGPELPVRSGTLDDKVLREVCRPGKDSSAADIAQKANEAGTKLKEANEAVLQKELAKSEKPAPTKTADGAPVPSIRPNLKAAAEASREQVAPPAKEAAREPAKEAPKPMPVAHEAPPAPAPKSRSVAVYNPAPAKSSHKASKSAKAPSGGYMLEVAHATPGAAAALPALQHAHIHWSYEGEGGPANWAALDPKNTLCASGQRQSPIDIRDGIKVDVEPIKFDYRPSTFRIVDNGHTVQVAVGDSTISLTGKTYELIQFHFHRPSEEKVNGRSFDMVAHLVHKADDGQLAVVAVLMERGSENPFIQTLWNNMPLEKNVTVEPPNLAINPADLLPGGRNYYTYMGSLTTPPCSEGVLWLVMKNPVQISPEQLNIFSRLYRNNARPIQPVNGRLIKEGR